MELLLLEILNTGKNILQIIVINKIEDGIQPPTGNGFPVFVFNLWRFGFIESSDFIVDTGLEISLPKGFAIEVESLISFQMDWSLSGMKDMAPKGRLLLKSTDPNLNKLKEEKTPIAKVWIVKRQVEKIRFLEKAPEGGRVIRGEGKIADSVETGSVESREQIPSTDTE
jgi:hypothetical protein